MSVCVCVSVCLCVCGAQDMCTHPQWCCAHPCTASSNTRQYGGSEATRPCTATMFGWCRRLSNAASCNAMSAKQGVMSIQHRHRHTHVDTTHTQYTQHRHTTNLDEMLEVSVMASLINHNSKGLCCCLLCSAQRTRWKEAAHKEGSVSGKR